jgi:hypothetical protein
MIRQIIREAGWRRLVVEAFSLVVMVAACVAFVLVLDVVAGL